MSQQADSSPATFSRRSAIQLAAGLAVAIPCFMLATRGVDWTATFATIGSARLSWLLAAAGLFTLATAVRGLRWCALLSAERPVSPALAFWATMVGNLGNNFFPLRAGEVLRSAMMGRAAGMSRTFVLASALMERVLDALVLMLLLPLCLANVTGLAHFSNRIYPLAILSVAGLAVLPFALKLVPQIEGVIARLPLLSPSLRSRASYMTGKFSHGLAAFFNTRRASIASALTVGAWGIDACAAAVVARAMDLHLNMLQAFTLLAALGLSSALPSTPGFVGIYQFVAVTVLRPFGFTRNEALAFILVFQGVIYAVFIVFGVVGLGRMRKAAAVASVRQTSQDAEPALQDR